MADGGGEDVDDPGESGVLGVWYGLLEDRGEEFLEKGAGIWVELAAEFGEGAAVEEARVEIVGGDEEIDNYRWEEKGAEKSGRDEEYVQVI